MNGWNIFAQLYNVVAIPMLAGVDAMIAATALMADAPLATNNAADFAPFRAAGLRLA